MRKSLSVIKLNLRSHPASWGCTEENSPAAPTMAGGTRRPQPPRHPAAHFPDRTASGTACLCLDPGGLSLFHQQQESKNNFLRPYPTSLLQHACRCGCLQGDIVRQGAGAAGLWLSTPQIAVLNNTVNHELLLKHQISLCESARPPGQLYQNPERNQKRKFTTPAKQGVCVKEGHSYLFTSAWPKYKKKS